MERTRGENEWQELVPLTRATSYVDPTGGPGARYRLTAVNGLGQELLLGETALGPTSALAVWPVPYRGGELWISFATAGGLGGGAGEASVEIYDVAGRKIRTVAHGEYPAGYQAVTWDGRDEQGRHVASGVYLIRTTTDGRTLNMKLVATR